MGVRDLLHGDLNRLATEEAERKALAEFNELTAARGCPPDLTMEEIVLGGYASMEEVMALKAIHDSATDEEE